MPFTKTRRNKNQRWFDLKCGHRQYGAGLEPWDGVKCLTCGKKTNVTGQQGPSALESMFRF